MTSTEKQELFNTVLTANKTDERNQAAFKLQYHMLDLESQIIFLKWELQQAVQLTNTQAKHIKTLKS